MQQYDTTLKLLLQRAAQQSIQELTGARVARWLNVELPELGNRRADLLGETTDGGLIHIELQSQNDAAMALRMAEYYLRIYRHLQRLPRQIVLYVGRARMRMPADLQTPHLSFRYDLVDIRAIHGEGLLKSDRIGDNVIAILTRLRDRRRAVQQIVRKVSELDEEARGFHLQALLTLAGLRGLEETVEEEAKRMPVFIDILENKVLGREYKRGREEGHQEGREEGREEGRQEGREEGREEGRLEALRDQMQERFGVLPDWAERRLAGLSAPEIKQVSLRLLKAESIEELLK